MYTHPAIAILRFAERVLPAIALALYLGILSTHYSPYMNAVLFCAILVLFVLSLAARETRVEMERDRSPRPRRTPVL